MKKILRIFVGAFSWYKKNVRNTDYSLNFEWMEKIVYELQSSKYYPLELLESYILALKFLEKVKSSMLLLKLIKVVQVSCLLPPSWSLIFISFTLS